MNTLLRKPKTCSSCQRTRTLEWSFCPFCLELDSGRACPTCRTALEPTWKHCPECGYPTSKADERPHAKADSLSESTDVIVENESTAEAPAKDRLASADTIEEGGREVVREPSRRESGPHGTQKLEAVEGPSPSSPAPDHYRYNHEYFGLIPPAVDLTKPQVRQYVQAFIRLLADDNLGTKEAREYMDAFAPTEYANSHENELWEKRSILRYFEFWGLNYANGSFSFQARKPVVPNPWPKPIRSHLNKLENKLKSNVLEALNFRWAPAGLIEWDILGSTSQGTAVRMRAARLRGQGPSNHWEAPGGAATLMEMRVFQWGTVAALKIHNRGGSDHSINTSWVKWNTPEDSNIRLRDLESSRTYWPIDSTLGSVVSHGRTEIRFVAFEPLQQPTNRLAVEARDVKLSKGTGRKDAFTLELEGNDVWRGSQVCLRDVPLTYDLEVMMRKQQNSP